MQGWKKNGWSQWSLQCSEEKTCGNACHFDFGPFQEPTFVWQHCGLSCGTWGELAWNRRTWLGWVVSDEVVVDDGSTLVGVDMDD